MSGYGKDVADAVKAAHAAGFQQGYEAGIEAQKAAEGDGTPTAPRFVFK